MIDQLVPGDTSDSDSDYSLPSSNRESDYLSDSSSDGKTYFHYCTFFLFIFYNRNKNIIKINQDSISFL